MPLFKNLNKEEEDEEHIYREKYGNTKYFDTYVMKSMWSLNKPTNTNNIHAYINKFPKFHGRILIFCYFAVFVNKITYLYTQTTHIHRHTSHRHKHKTLVVYDNLFYYLDFKALAEWKQNSKNKNERIHIYYINKDNEIRFKLPAHVFVCYEKKLTLYCIEWFNI